MSRPGMSRHLASCKGRRAGSGTALHLFVESADWLEFWLHIEAGPRATLRDLDSLLRRIWLECCGHLSSFEVEGVCYQSETFDDSSWGPPVRSMNVRLERVLAPGARFN